MSFLTLTEKKVDAAMKTDSQSVMTSEKDFDQKGKMLKKKKSLEASIK